MLLAAPEHMTPWSMVKHALIVVHVHDLENRLLAVDEMGGRLDELEKSISDLVQQAGVESSPSGTPEKA